MKAEEFLKELEYLLQDIPEEEKGDAIAYYQDYFQEAGEEHEQDVIQELGSPERVAAMIRAELGGNLEEGGAFTDSGYQDERFRDPRYQVAERRELPDIREKISGEEKEADGSWKTERADGSWKDRLHRAGDCFRRSGERFRRGEGQARRADTRQGRLLRVILLLAVLCVASPVLLGLGGTAAAAAAGIGCLVIVAVVLIGVVTVAACIGAAAVLVLGFGMLFTSGWSGVLVIGCGVFLLGLALFGIALSVLVYGTLIPGCIRSVVDWIGGLLHRGRRTRT